MSQQIIQVNFRFTISRDKFEDAVATVASRFANVPGLQWKIWLMNEASLEAGGIYLFESREAAESFKNSELYKGTATYPGFTVKQFDILEEASLVTHAPLDLKTGINRMIINN